jgi:hypothetical protein
MLNHKLRLAILVSLVLAPFGAGNAADMQSYCRLKGGSLVPLTAAACAAEGGTMVSAEIAPAEPAAATAPGAAPAAAVAVSAAAVKPTGNDELDQAEKQVVEILGKGVGLPLAPGAKPESIARSASFDGCRLSVEEQMHMDFGNIFTSRKQFKINSVVDFQNIARKSIGKLGSISSRAGDLSGYAVSVEELMSKAGNNMSVSVLQVKDGKTSKYESPGTSASGESAPLAAAKDYYWIFDGYGYPVDIINTVQEIPAMDMIRVLYIVDTEDAATQLLNALDKVSAICRQQAGSGQPNK